MSATPPEGWCSCDSSSTRYTHAWARTHMLGGSVTHAGGHSGHRIRAERGRGCMGERQLHPRHLNSSQRPRNHGHNRPRGWLNPGPQSPVCLQRVSLSCFACRPLLLAPPLSISSHPNGSMIERQHQRCRLPSPPLPPRPVNTRSPQMSASATPSLFPRVRACVCLCYVCVCVMCM
jgi:hypothetical protein